MKETLIILDILINTYCPENKEKLISYLPKKNQDYIHHILLEEKEFNIESFFGDKILDEIHYSWLIPFLNSFPKKIAAFFLAVFPNEPLKKNLELSSPTFDFTDFLKSYLKEALISSLFENEKPPIPAQYIPNSTLSSLLSLSKKNLVLLIDYLSMYDLAFELKHIVDTKILKKLFSVLKKDEVEFLKKIMSQQEPFSFSRMGLERWDGNEHTLNSLLHKRGINRLAIALSIESENLIWHISHRLDIGRGSMLIKSVKKEVAPSIVDHIQANVIELITNLNNL